MPWATCRVPQAAYVGRLKSNIVWAHIQLLPTFSFIVHGNISRSSSDIVDMRCGTVSVQSKSAFFLKLDLRKSVNILLTVRRVLA